MMPLALELSAPALFVAGATTSLHCALMCGAINAVMTRPQAGRSLRETLALVHAGRVLGYAVLGGVAGALGAQLAFWLPDTLTGGAIQGLASLALVAAGLQHWATHRTRVQPACCASRANVTLKPFFRGLLWALMPCGILYTVLVLAALTTHALSGALLLAAFGLGTVPLMGLSGSALGLAARPQQGPRLRRWAAAALIVLGCAGTYASLAQADFVAALCAPAFAAR